MSIQAMAWAKDIITGKPGAKSVLLVLADYADETGIAWPSKSTIARVTEQSEDTVRRHLRYLETMDILSRVDRWRDTDGGQTSNQYQLSLTQSTPPANCTPPLPQTEDAPRGRITEGGTSESNPHEQPVEPPVEPPENTLPLGENEMWSVYQEVTGKTRYQLTPTREKRLTGVIKDMKKRDLGLDLMTVWTVMVRCIWSDPWRQERMTHHDPKNILRDPEQIESWVLAAVESIERDSDGSDHHFHESGQAERVAARQEEAHIQKVRTKSRVKTKERTDREQEDRDQEIRDHNERLREWFGKQPKEVKDRIRRRVEKQAGDSPSRFRFTLTWTTILTDESGIKLGTGRTLTRLTV